MYEELTKQLRSMADYLTEQKSPLFPIVIRQAADAIEELSKEAARWQAEAKDWYLAYMNLLPEPPKEVE